MKTWICKDEGEEREVKADTARNAAEAFAEEYPEPGPWEGTYFHEVEVRDASGDEDDWRTVTVTVNPIEPDCKPDQDHDWHEDGPECGLWGKGGGVVSRACCIHCGVYYERDTWAMHPENGSEGWSTEVFKPATAASRAWVVDHVVDEIMDEAPRAPEGTQMTSFKIKWAHGLTTTHDTYDAACDAVRAVYSEAEIGHDGDISEGGSETLCWPDEARAEGDDGSRACARIVALYDAA